MFAQKKILLGITGGIAAYKSCELIRELKRQHAEIRVVLTAAARQFVTPLTLATLAENPVLGEMFGEEYATTTIHIEAARWADVVLICPATANTIGKIANGLADNLLTTLIMATTAPVVFCPAMNKEMIGNPLYLSNVEKLQQLGYHFVAAGEGELACGEFGIGRLADTHRIINKLRRVLLGTTELAGKRVLITASRTEEPIDPVRFITNAASGKMGFELATAAALRGAEVTLISGPTSLMPFDDVHYIQVRTSDEMADAVMQHLERQDIVIMAAAVADFKPAFYSAHKIKKDQFVGEMQLEKTRDILKTIGQQKNRRLLVGFALETDNEIAHAQAKLQEKHLDLIVVNNPLAPGAGFQTDTNIVTLIDAQGHVEKLPLMSKFQVANRIIDEIVSRMPM
ncbi:MAG: bifunctional phosphopantothenoylcysteine decarboxylase/phosphopantothenate--cysteine ligase CoaBC [candidate division KSB1 bacterium]|nr:bifunctional phosphopantothenoylcysteine decarboxylase/phosphopantothenate--cysteine ligase CoaBC [candidate division KSB1 bacterium]MDZ7319015.1 bifunctional phosphopantothenoylcysteine decarboxylase/phosphopantothenate--cysteine ligase CoaBC [candidate division KSB1 bacterium]MDZ7339803.1 bifunctional phosphopantothenoylcysteine decarboxylase/phosphopantothenate--cysteine ligase CoaBC [candidate division KSB1 bacterium]